MYNEHIPPQEAVEGNELMSLMEVHKAMLAVSMHHHNHKCYVPLVDWAEEFVHEGVSSNGSRNRSHFADLEDPFENFSEDDDRHVTITDYAIPYGNVGKQDR